MASINGIELKSLKEFRGHEGEPLYQANVYYKGKKVAFWSQDSWGGICDNFELDYTLPKELKEEIKGILDNYVSDSLFKGISDLYDKQYNISFEHKEFKGLEYLFSELLELQQQENTYKKYSKQWGINTIAICYKDYFNSTIRGSRLSKNMFEENLKKDKDIALYYIYDSLEDFKKIIQREEI